MAMAADLVAASKLSFQQIVLTAGGPGSDFSEGLVKTAVANFVADTLPVFPDTPPGNRPVGDWLIPLSAIESTMQPGNGILSLVILDEIVDVVAKMASAGNTAASLSQITGAQAAALLAAWNSAFGT